MNDDSLLVTNSNPFHAKNYDLFVLLGAPDLLPWQWQIWVEIEPLLAPFVCSDRGKSIVRSSQASGLGKEYRSIAFGKMGWDLKSHLRWTHGSPSNALDSNPRRFLGMEAWGPSWTVCEKEHEAPDFYLHLLSAPNARQGGIPRFGSMLVVALTASASGERRRELRAAMIAVAALLKSPLAVCKRRAWGIASGAAGGFRDAVQDLGVGRGLFREEDPHAQPVSLETFSEAWSPLRA
ncbi:hypothetical protein [Variovorax sp. YR750]|uniref:hypothetical protein n=1 Tax=Variovorax sp. YR750 TaxID=1884384 RepID=UPI00210E3FA3|nr:hypothetical protein [Variovorax sp. YR750]